MLSHPAVTPVGGSLELRTQTLAQPLGMGWGAVTSGANVRLNAMALRRKTLGSEMLADAIGKRVYR